MRLNRIRFWALAILVVLLAAQFHVCVDAAGLKGAAHACQICVSGAWADVPVQTGLSIPLAVQRLENSSRTQTPKLARTESRTPRAPPSV
jgi:hypothetical protein